MDVSGSARARTRLSGVRLDGVAPGRAARAVSLAFVQNTNYMQAIEGAIDTVHVWFLHRGVEPDWQHRSALSMDHSPRLEVEDTAYGFRYAAMTPPGAGRRYAQVDSRDQCRVADHRPHPTAIAVEPLVEAVGAGLRAGR